jgi:hypothetical protein
MYSCLFSNRLVKFITICYNPLPYWNVTNMFKFCLPMPCPLLNFLYPVLHCIKEYIRRSKIDINNCFLKGLISWFITFGVTLNITISITRVTCRSRIKLRSNSILMMNWSPIYYWTIYVHGDD